MHKSLACLGLAMLALSVLLGCGASPGSSANRADSALRSASPDVKAGWEKAKAAIAVNDYVTATTNLQNLFAAPGLTPEQKQAIQQTATAVSDQLYAAANRGDPAAKQAIQDLRKLSAR